MDIKITFDVTPKLAGIAEKLCDALKSHAARIPAHCIPAPSQAEPLKWDTPKEASNSPVETPEPVEVSKPVEVHKNEPEAKIEAQAAANDDAPAPEVKDETPAESPKPKRSHHKKVEAPKPEPQPEPEKAAEPECDPKPEAESEPEADADAEGETEMSLDDVRAICVQATKAGKTKVVTDFLAAHNAQSLSKLDPKHYAELAANVKAAL